MFSIAALMLANSHLEDLYAEANRERRADHVREALKPGTHRSPVERLRVSAHRLGRIVRALPKATAGEGGRS